MKSLVLALMVLATSQVFAGTVELGRYTALDKDSKSVSAALELKAGGAANVVITVPGVTTVHCSGSYGVAGDTLNTDLNCDSMLLSKAKVSINIASVTPASVRSANGAEVTLTIPGIIDDPTVFLLKKAN